MADDRMQLEAVKPASGRFAALDNVFENPVALDAQFMADGQRRSDGNRQAP